MQENTVSSDETWPVIVSSTLQSTDIFTLLNDVHKVRVSATIIENSVIFPKSAVAFLVLAIRDIPSKKDRYALDEKIVERVAKFGQIHRNSFILTTSTMMEKTDLAILSTLQERFFTFSFSYYPAHNDKECVSFMLHIAKVTSKPTSTLLTRRLSNLTTSSTSEEIVLNILKVMGLSCHDCFVLHQGCHSLSNIAQSSIQQLMDCSLDQETAKKVYHFFRNT